MNQNVDDSKSALPDTDSVRETNLRILRGELTVESALKSGLVSESDIRHFQAKHLISLSGNAPWQEVLVGIWMKATRGSLKYVVIPLFILFILIPAIASFYESGLKLYSSIASLFASAPASEMWSSELDVCNEWIAQVGQFDDRADANQEKEYLVQAMKDANEFRFIYDVQIVRDPQVAKKFLLLVDIWDGASSREAVAEEVKRLQNLKGPVGDSLSNKMQAARAIYYRKSDFETTYGQLSPKAQQCKYEETNLSQ